MNEEFTVCLESTLRNNSEAVEFGVTPPPDSTIGDLLLLALDRTGLKHKSDEAYGFCLDRNSTKILSIETKAHTLPTRRLHLRQIMVRISVYITASQEEQIFGLSPLMTVNDAVLFMENAAFKGADFDLMRDSLVPRTPQHELLLITNASLAESSVTQGIPLEYSRTLRSYRVSQADTMILTEATAMGQRWQTVTGSMGSDLIPVLIHAPCFGLRKAMKVSPRGTFREVLEMFLEKSNQVVLPRFYTLCVEMGGEPGDVMNLEDQLDSYPLPTPARLQCIPAPRPAQVVFGVDPAGLPLVSDNGVQIPEVLVDLRDMLLLLEPYDEEGIFRKAGNENEMKRMIHNFNKGRPVESTDIHSVATLLKRWFKDLPKRVLASVSKDILQHEERLFRVWEELPPIESALCQWLFELLVDISRHSDHNMMIPSNMGIVFGPGLYGSSGALTDTASRFAAMASLSGDSSTGCEIVERVLAHLLQHPECRPLKPEQPMPASLSAGPYHPPAVHGGPSTPGAMMPRGPVLIDLSGDSKMAQLLAKRRALAEGNALGDGEQAPSSSSAPSSSTPTPTLTPGVAPSVQPKPPAPRALPQPQAPRTGAAPARGGGATSPRAGAGGRGGGSGPAPGGRIQSVMFPGAVSMQDELKNRLNQRKSMGLVGGVPGLRAGMPSPASSSAVPVDKGEDKPAALRSTASADPRVGFSPSPSARPSIPPKAPTHPPAARPAPQPQAPTPPAKPSTGPGASGPPPPAIPSTPMPSVPKPVPKPSPGPSPTQPAAPRPVAARPLPPSRPAPGRGRGLTPAAPGASPPLSGGGGAGGGVGGAPTAGGAPVPTPSAPAPSPTATPAGPAGGDGGRRERGPLPPGRRPAPALARRKSSPSGALVRSENDTTPPSPQRTPPGPPSTGEGPPSRPAPGGSHLRRSLPSTSFVQKAESKALPSAPSALSPRSLDAPSRPAPPPPDRDISPPPTSPRGTGVSVALHGARPLKKNYPQTAPPVPPPSSSSSSTAAAGSSTVPSQAPPDPHSPERDPPRPGGQEQPAAPVSNKPLPVPPRPRPKSMFPGQGSSTPLGAGRAGGGLPPRPPVPGGRPPPPPRGEHQTLARSVSEVHRGVKHEAPGLATSKQQSTPSTKAIKVDTDSPRAYDWDMDDDDDDDESIMRELMDFVASERRCSDDLGFDSPPPARREAPIPRNQSTPHTQLSPRGALVPPPVAPPTAHSVSTILTPPPEVDKPKRARSVRFVKKKPPLGSQGGVAALAPAPAEKGGKRFSKRLGLGFKKDHGPSPGAHSPGEGGEAPRPVHIPTEGVKWGKSKDAEELFAKLKSEGFSL